MNKVFSSNYLPLTGGFLFALLFNSLTYSNPSSPTRPGKNIAWLSPIANTFVSCSFQAKHCSTETINQGIDYATTRQSAVVAPIGGLVIVSAEQDPFFPNQKHLVVIKHNEHTQIVISKLGKLLVKTGQRVKRGQRIAMTQAPTLHNKTVTTHLELIENGNAVDPFTKLPYVFFDLSLSNSGQ